MSKVLWSQNRPKRPEVDPMLGDLRSALMKDNRSTFAQANVSGLAPATIRNIITGKTRRPQSLTVQMAYRVLGYELRPVKVRGK